MRIVVQQIRVLVAVTAFTSGSWFNINSVKVAHEMTMTCNKLYVVEIRLEEFWDLRCGKVAFEIVVYIVEIIFNNLFLPNSHNNFPNNLVLNLVRN